MRWVAALKQRFAALRLTERIHRRTNFQRGFLYLGARRALMGGRKWTPLDYFRNGEQGAWYDPSDLSTLFQDSAGTIPVTAVEQPVGLILDKRLGLVRGVELCADPGFNNPSAWASGGASPQWIISGGSASISGTAATARFLTKITPTLTVGKTYEVTADVIVTAGSVAPDIDGFSRDVTTSGHKRWILTTSITNINFIARASFIGSITNVSFRELPGNHAFQTTATSRPILRQDANGKYYLYADGIDDFMVTNSIDFTGTDKMTVVTGLRKIGTAASAPIELSTNTNTNAGAFGVYTQAGTNSYSFASGGTDPAVASKSPAAYVPPITNVITGIANISAPLNQLRVDGSVTTTVTTSQGTGNFGNYPLYLFRRGLGVLQFNGHFYGLIIRGAETQDALLNPGQRYIAGKTGVVL